MRHYCTYFDKYYLAAGAALAISMQRLSEEPFTLWVLALDDDARRGVERLGISEVRVVPLQVLESADPELLSVKTARTLLEYYFTCTASWIRHLFQSQPEIDALIYLDADQLFFSNPAAIHEQFGDANVMLVEHGAPASMKIAERFGRFNVGLIAFRRGVVTDAILARWREQCLDWCHVRLGANRFAEQKYLDDWPGHYAGVKIAFGPAAGLAPWNWHTRRLSLDGGVVCVDGVPLVYYHFHAFRFVTRHVYDSGLTRYRRMPAKHRKWIYDRYATALLEAARELRRRGTAVSLGPANRWSGSARHLTLLAGQIVRRRWPSVHFVTALSRDVRTL